MLICSCTHSLSHYSVANVKQSTGLLNRVLAIHTPNVIMNKDILEEMSRKPSRQSCKGLILNKKIDNETKYNYGRQIRNDDI